MKSPLTSRVESAHPPEKMHAASVRATTHALRLIATNHGVAHRQTAEPILSVAAEKMRLNLVAAPNVARKTRPTTNVETGGLMPNIVAQKCRVMAMPIVDGMMTEVL